MPSVKSNKRPSHIVKLDLRHLIVVCGKSVLLLENEVFFHSVPIYSPRNLERLINLGCISTAKRILYSMEEFHKTVMEQQKQSNSLINYFYNPKQIELEVPMPSIKQLLDDQDNFTHGQDRRESFCKDESYTHGQMEKVEELKLSFGSSSSDEEDDVAPQTGDLTVSDILTRYRLTGLTRAEQLTLEAIWESLTTATPAGIDKPGVAFVLQLNHKRCVAKYFGRNQHKQSEDDVDLESSATVWAFHSDSQSGIISILLGKNII